jgi:hypothetical protein
MLTFAAFAALLMLTGGLLATAAVRPAHAFDFAEFDVAKRARFSAPGCH